jgi:hypothetical protein
VDESAQSGPHNGRVQEIQTENLRQELGERKFLLDCFEQPTRPARTKKDEAIEGNDKGTSHSAVSSMWVFHCVLCALTPGSV